MNPLRSFFSKFSNSVVPFIFSMPLMGFTAEGFFIQGYLDKQSYFPGETIRFHLSGSVSSADLDIRRVGTNTDLLERLPSIETGPQPVPDDASAMGCRWPVSTTFTLPQSWRSGLYEVIPTGKNAEGLPQKGTKMRFVLKPGTRSTPAPILMHLTFNTENAYCNFGGYSLYAYNGRDGVQGTRVSFLRPMAGFSDRWEVPFINWAESEGYRIDYCANSDLHYYPEMLQSYPLVISVGHDEYWSSGMRDSLEVYVRRGGNLAVFSGNTSCWQVRYVEGGNAMVSWKQKPRSDPWYSDPTKHHLLSTLWSHHLVDRPENRLLGVGFLFGGYHRSHGQFMDGTGAFEVHQPEHWAFEGTGLQRGDAFGGKDTIVGYECDGCDFILRDGFPRPTGRDGTPLNFKILATSPARWHPDDCEWYERWEKGRSGAACLGIHTLNGGGTVFTTGTTDWSHGLAGKDPVVERITRNVLDRLGKRGSY